MLSCFLPFPRLWDYPSIEDKWEDCRKKVTSSLDERGAGIGIHPIALNRIRNSFCRRRALAFCDLFQYLFRNSVATDPRDFIYRLHGLLNHQGRDQMSVGLQGSCILILDPDRFDLTVGGR
jgi:hypothetical protein